MLRACALLASSLILAVGAHAIGGGGVPAPVAVALAASILGPIAIVLTRRRCRFWGLLAIVGLQQVLLHTVFASMGARVGCSPTATMLGSDHAAHLQAAALSACAGMAASMGPHMMMPSLSMIVAHAAATVATVWLLARGESWLWRVVSRLISKAEPAPELTAVESTGWVCNPLLQLAGRGWQPAAPRGPPRAGAALL